MLGLLAAENRLRLLGSPAAHLRVDRRRSLVVFSLICAELFLIGLYVCGARWSTSSSLASSVRDGRDSFLRKRTLETEDRQLTVAWYGEDPLHDPDDVDGVHGFLKV